MKVIAASSNNNFICEVNQHELQKFMNLYYNKDSKRDMKVGDVIDLDRGYDFHSDIVSALNQTREFVGKHAKVIDAITKGFLVEQASRELAS